MSRHIVAVASREGAQAEGAAIKREAERHSSTRGENISRVREGERISKEEEEVPRTTEVVSIIAEAAVGTMREVAGPEGAVDIATIIKGTIETVIIITRLPIHWKDTI